MFTYGLFYYIFIYIYIIDLTILRIVINALCNCIIPSVCVVFSLYTKDSYALLIVDVPLAGASIIWVLLTIVEISGP